MELPDIYNLDNFQPVKPDVLKITVNNNIITVYYNDFQIDSILSTDKDCYIYNLNGSHVNNILGNKVIRINKYANSYSYFAIDTNSSHRGHIVLCNNNVFKVDYVLSIIVDIKYNGECIIYIYDNNTIISQPSIGHIYVSYLQCNKLSLIHNGTFAYGIVFGCKGMDSSHVNIFLVKMKYYNYYKGIIMIPSECDKIELYYYKYVINNVVYLALHKMVNNNTIIFATKDNKNRVIYNLNKITQNLKKIPRQIEISINNYDSQNGLFAFHTFPHT